MPDASPPSSPSLPVLVDGLAAKMALDLAAPEPTDAADTMPRPRAKTHDGPRNDTAAVKPFCDRIKRARQQQQRHLLRQRERRAKSVSAADAEASNLRKMQRLDQLLGVPTMARGSKRLRICNLVVHAVVPQTNTTKHRHTEYALIVEHVLSGRVWEVSRRYSAFVELRRELVKALEGDVPKRKAVHCGVCAAMLTQLHALDAQFPAKRFFDSRRPKVVLARAAAFCAYTQQVVALAGKAHQSSCRNVSARYCGVLYAFLTVEREDFRSIPAAASEPVVPSLLREIAGGAGIRLSRIEEADDGEDVEQELEQEMTTRDVQHAGSISGVETSSSSGSDEPESSKQEEEVEVEVDAIESEPRAEETDEIEIDATAA